MTTEPEGPANAGPSLIADLLLQISDLCFLISQKWYAIPIAGVMFT